MDEMALRFGNPMGVQHLTVVQINEDLTPQRPWSLLIIGKYDPLKYKTNLTVD